MTIDRRLEDDLPRMLAELGAGAEPDYTDLILQRAAHARQRSGWTLPSRWMPRPVAPVAPGSRLVPAFGLLLLVLTLVATAVLIGTRPRLPQPFGPARNGAIVYSSGGDIFAGTPGNPSMALVSGPEIDFEPFYSPDGTRLAFYRQFGDVAGAATDIMVLDAAGTGLTRLTARPLSEIPWSAAWTPDGSRIVIQTNERFDGRLLSFDATREGDPRAIDGAVRDLGLRMDSFAFQPPDSRRILFAGQIASRIGLFVMNSDGTDLTTLIEPYLAQWPQNSGGYWNIAADVRDLRNPIWSPDGRSIVIQRYEVTAASRQMRLFMMDADGANIHPITTPAGDSLDGDPVWSPDGSRIAFVRYLLDRSVWTYAVLRLADGAVTTTGPTIPDGLDHNDWSPGVPTIAWAPDSSRIFAIERAGPRQAYLLDPEGGDYETLPWHVETPQSWGLQGLNGFDLGSWQRKASP